MAEDQVVEGQNQVVEQAAGQPRQPIDLDGILEAFKTSGNYFYARMNNAQRAELEDEMIEMLRDFNRKQIARKAPDDQDVISVNEAANQTAVWFKCPGGEIVTDRRLCPGGVAVKQGEAE
jgi:hypothetical protein